MVASQAIHGIRVTTRGRFLKGLYGMAIQQKEILIGLQRPEEPAYSDL